MALDLQKVLEQFAQLKVLVVGDIMLDSYIQGKVERVSPEAPVPIVNVQQKEHRLGGAANVALNIKSLGAEPILCGLVGGDEPSKQILRLLDNKDMHKTGIVSSASRRTTVKTRVICSRQQLLRFDEEDTHPMIESESAQLKSAIEDILPTCQAVIFEDYDKGCLDEGLIQWMIDLAQSRNIPTIVDPKDHNFGAYREVTLLKPNLKELVQALGRPLDTVDSEHLAAAASELHGKLAFQSLLVTLSEYGAFYWKDGAFEIIDAHRREIADVSGAGDTVVAVAGLAAAIGLPIANVTQLANLAGGIVCEHAGVVPLDARAFLEEFRRYYS
ncbi:MAG: PfkB family carbohydrate kinase [Bacteroidota bacterium]